MQEVLPDTTEHVGAKSNVHVGLVEVRPWGVGSTSAGGPSTFVISRPSTPLSGSTVWPEPTSVAAPVDRIERQ
jgi:hypothetical protein